MKIKKILFSSAIAALMMSGLVGCGGGESGTKLTIWVSEAKGVAELTKQQIKDFNKNNEDGIKIAATIEKVSESDSATQMLNDVSAGADIFCFAQDQFARLVQGGALSKLGNLDSATVKKENDAGSVAAVTSGDAIYAYPMTSDNGYFLYYDTRVLSANDVKNVTTILEKCTAAGKNFSFEMQSSAWYLASYFFGTGCVSEWTTNDEGTYTALNDTFNSDKGLIAVKGMQELVQSTAHQSSSAVSDFAAATPSAAVVSGTWAYNDVVDILGDNMGVAELPYFTVDGKDYHLGSYSGNKLMGVKPLTDEVKAEAAHKLAAYLTSEKCQLERFNAVAWGPSNLKAQADEAVQANPALAALAKQNAYATPQGQIHGSWWDIAKVIGTGVKDAAKGDEAALKAVLEKYETDVYALLNVDPAVARAFTVIGKIASLECNWDADIAMTEEPEGTWTSDVITLAEGDEFKVRQGKSWDVAYPAQNFVVSAEQAGEHRIQLVVESGEVTLL